MKLLKIVKITPVDLSNGGGVETVVPLLAQGLSDRGHEVIVYSQETDAEIEFEDFESKPILNPTSPLRVFWELARMKPSPDIIHSHLVLPGALLGLLSQPDSTHIVTSHGYDIQVDRGISYGMRLKPHYSLLMKALLPMMDKHCIVSDAMREDAVAAGSPQKNIRTVNNPVPTPPSNLEPRQSHRGNEYLLYLGRLHRKKNIPELIGMLSPTLKDKNIDFLICGTGDDYRKIRKRIDEEGVEDHCKLLGFVTEHEKWVLYNSALAFLMNSSKEAFGITSIEAMSVGTPVIAVDQPPFDEYIQDGYNGYLYSTKREVSESINKIIENNIELSINSKKYSKNYLVQNVAKHHEEMYYNLLSSV